ncbi:MAG: hypothetical protein WC511_02840 [Candidatus Pacearchaeota archaeon]
MTAITGVEGGMVYRSFLTKNLEVICFEEYTCTDGTTYWNLPMVLDVMVQKDPTTQEPKKTSYLRPLLPVSRTMKFKRMGYDAFLCEIEDADLKSAYFQTVDTIKSQLSGIVTPPKGPMIIGGGNRVIS